MNKYLPYVMVAALVAAVAAVFLDEDKPAEKKTEPVAEVVTFKKKKKKVPTQTSGGNPAEGAA